MSKAIVTAHAGGLFSNITKCLVAVRMFDEVEIDWTRGRCAYKCETNLWDKLFDYNWKVKGDCALISDYVGEMWNYTAIGQSKLYLSDGAWRREFNDYWIKMKVKHGHASRAMFESSNLWKTHDPIACIIRCNRHGGEQLLGKNQSLDQYAQAFEKHRREDSILHVLCGDLESLVWLQARFPVTCCPAERTANRDIDFFKTEQPWEAAVEALNEVLICSRARALIHGVSNLATGSLYINANQESIYLP